MTINELLQYSFKMFLYKILKHKRTIKPLPSENIFFSDEELESITSKAARVLELKSSVRQDLDDDNILLNVEERQNTLGRASLLHQVF